MIIEISRRESSLFLIFKMLGMESVVKTLVCAYLIDKINEDGVNLRWRGLFSARMHMFASF